MEIQIKQLKQQGNVIFPQTSAEAVIVKSQEGTVTLNKFINKTTSVIVNGVTYKVLGGYTNQNLKFGSDFKADDSDGIQLKWNKI